MAKRERSSRVSNGILGFVLVVLFALAALIIWSVVPMLADETFGTASPYLTASQKWTYSARLLLHENELTSPGCAASAPVDVKIELGDSILTITARLSAASVISDQTSFRNYLIYKGIDTNIRADTYSLSCTSSPVLIADQIENHTLEEVTFDILPGWRAEEVANALTTSGIDVSPQDFLAVVENPEKLNLPSYIPVGHSLEGFLFPGEYTVARTITATDLAQMFIDRFDQQVNQAGLYKENTQGLTFYQTVILASIIQRETYADAERPLIASVFYNRLSSNMKLETDPTVQYALGYSDKWGWWKSPLSQADLTVQSPYNTYQIDGLPPAPIANPDLSSLRAAENPAESDDYYFRAKCDNSGLHVFARTLAEQIANACK